MVRIRLRRMGAKKHPTYRIVVARQQNARNGRFLEIVGTYDPHKPQDNVTLVRDRIAHWLSVGAQPSDAVARMLRNAGMLDANNNPVPQEEAAEAAALTESTPDSVTESEIDAAAVAA